MFKFLTIFELKLHYPFFFTYKVYYVDSENASEGQEFWHIDIWLERVLC